MKKIRFLSLLAIAPLALLASCSTGNASFGLSANWFSNVSSKTIPDDFEETLEYAVSFERSTASLKGKFTMDYPNGGTYTVKFEDGATEDGQKTYIYTTELKMDVQYSLNNTKSAIMQDVVKTRVEFLDTSNELKPLSSHREVKATAPVTTPSAPSAKLEECYMKLDYVMDISYNHEKNKAVFNLTYLTAISGFENIENKEIKIKNKGIFFDNEQLIPALRAAELSSSMSIYTIDPQTHSLESLTVKDGPKAVSVTQSVKLKSETEPTEKKFEANEIGIAYKKKNSGGTHKYTIATCKVPDDNKYRNVCLKYEYPIINSHGTLTYTLLAANFYN